MFKKFSAGMEFRQIDPWSRNIRLVFETPSDLKTSFQSRFSSPGGTTQLEGME
jgi:hypothetical protein